MLRALIANIRDGTRLALFRDVDYDEFTVDYKQLAAFLAIGAVIDAILEGIAITEPGATDVDWPAFAADYAGYFAGSVAIALVQRSPDRIVGFMVVDSAASILLMLIFLTCSTLMAAADAVAPLDSDTSDVALGVSMISIALAMLFIVSAFVFVIGYRAIRCTFEVGPGRALLLLFVLYGLSFAPGLALEPRF